MPGNRRRGQSQNTSMFAWRLLNLGLVLGLKLTDVGAAEESLQEVVVTAQRRTENLQDVPEAITAVSGEVLNALHWQGTPDLAKEVPNLSFDVLGPGESTLALRGLGTAYGLAPAVSFYINETPLDIRTDGYSGAPDIDFFDVERVEVLRGPQGTLYGSSAMGGAVRILTAQPDPKTIAINAEAGGSALDGGSAGYFGKSAVNLPLRSDAAVRLVGAYEHVGGYISQVRPGNYATPMPDGPVTARRINDADIKSGRIIGLWTPADGLTVKPTFMISEVDASNNSNVFTNLPADSVAAYYSTPQTSRLKLGNLELDYDFGVATLMSSTSLLSRDTETVSDFTLFFADLAPLFGVPYPPNAPGTDSYTSHNAGFIQELRLTSPSDRRLRWVAGAYFSHFRQHSTESTNDADFNAEIGGTGANLYSFGQSVIDQQAALFADLTYRVLRQLELTAGTRYYELRDSLTNAQSGALAAPNQPLVHARADGTSPRVVLTYHPLDGSTIYASASRGYRPGGPNVGLPANIGCTLGNAYQPLYAPDFVWNYEIGAKTELLDRRLTINAAGFRIDWKGVQQAVADPGCGYIFIANVGNAQSTGAEIEISWKPLDGFVLGASGSYLDAQFKSIAGPFQGAAAVTAGDPIPDVPRSKVNLSIEYSRPVVRGLEGYVGVDGSHLSSVPSGFTYRATRPEYGALDAHIGVRGSRYDVSLYGHNLTNSTGVLEILEGASYSYDGVFRTQILTPPRTVGIDFKVHY
jgi:iron complex outermembrane recepter protein